MNIDQLLLYFDNWERAGGGRFKASCPMPNHEDSTPSVSLSQDVTTGNILMYCWGCDTKAPELVKALGLTIRDLFGDPGHPSAITPEKNNTIISEEELQILRDYVSQTQNHLSLASGYINSRFGLTIETSGPLKLGVDPGDSTFNRPAGYEAFNSGVPHLIIPLCDPDGNPIGMQGRSF